MTDELKRTYNPGPIEHQWYPVWEKAGYFHAPEKNPGRDTPYCIVIPPPNVTGSLHMGHALDNVLQDILIRYHRMRGAPTLWMPGTDHAGIATQNVVERQLLDEGTSRHDLGRERFVARVWEWVDGAGGTILHQLRKLGCSCDWERTRFTLDDGLSHAVREVFVQLYDEGLIYRSERLINWCTRCHTALSDLESEPKDIPGHLYHIKYPVKDSDAFLTIATTRPETMLGDTAVAIHPDDDRFTAFHGKTAILPLVEREIPIITDEAVKTEFGTGALKITPAHDPVDYDIGVRHDLPFISIFDENGAIADAGRQYIGLDRFDAREKILADLDAQGLLVKTEDHTHAVGHCYRCHTIVEPRLSMQWFVKIEPLARPAIDAVESGRTQFVPEHWTKTYLTWMYNIRDWCISRQLWWGHQIPAWYCAACEHVTVSREDPSACGGCGGTNLTRDPDVLDTWFSSGLWPFSTLGWPEQTDALTTYYPTSVLVTAFDIIFFWVARMMMMGLKFMGEVPFREVYIHALVRDAEGQKMSKSKGNVVDPLGVIDTYGADPFRFTLAAFAAQGREIKMDESRIEGYRKFANKIWQAARFALANIDGQDGGFETPAEGLAERWIESRLAQTIAVVREAFDTYKFNQAASALYSFIWNELCDWYIEFSKDALHGDDAAAKADAQRTLARVFDGTFRLLHPVMPFLTEELWQRLPAGARSGEPSIMIAPFPTVDEFHHDAHAEREMAVLHDTINALRNLRGENSVSPAKKIAAHVYLETESARQTAAQYSGWIERLAGCADITFDAPGTLPDDVASAPLAGGGGMVAVPLTGLIDVAEETKRLEKEIAKAETEVKKASGKLDNDKFIANAPPDIVDKERARLDEWNDKLVSLKAALDRLRKLDAGPDACA